VNDETGWVVGQKGIIIKTTDGGINWEILNSGTMKDLYCVYFINSDVGYTAGSNGTILKTTDGGGTWNTQTNTFPDNSSIRTVFFVNENVGWAGGSNYILSTKSGGTTWLRYDDWWATWVYSMFFLNDQVGFWVGRMVKKTTDGGSTWNELNSWDNGIPFVYEYYDMFFVDDSVGWITCSDGSILKTTDGGNWWTTQSQLNNAGSIFFKDQNTGWAAVYGEGIFKTEDGGVNWSKTSIKGIEDIFFSQTNGFLVGIGGKILKSVDEGNQWIDAYQNLVPNIDLNSIFFNDAQLGFAVGDSGKILKTEDSGNTWLHQTSPMKRNLNSIYFTDANTGWIAGYEVILKTNNRGEAWQLKYISTYADFNDIYFVNSDTGWVIGDKIHITENGGQSWTPQTLPNVTGNYYLNGVFISDKLNGWVVGNNGRMFNTIDGGVAWQKVIVPTTEDLFGIKFVDDNIGWIVGENGTILKSTDSGITWNIQNYNTNFDRFKLHHTYLR